MVEKKINLKESLSKLNGIVEWFNEQEEIDVEVGLEKVKEGTELIKACKKRLTEVENEFKEIQKEVEKE
jgi:exodeoxyribonuclease VII small subunit